MHSRPLTAVSFVISVLVSLSVSEAAEVVRIPPDRSLQEAAERASKRRHDDELQRRQHEHERELQREALKALEPNPGAVANVTSQPISMEATRGLLNGRAWRTWTPEMKAFYLTAMYEGIRAGGSVHPSGATMPKAYESLATLTEMAEGIDAFYLEPVNGVIPIALATQIFAARSRGDSAEEIANLTRQTLKALSDESPIRSPVAPYSRTY